ncbi:MAG: Na+/H+ antiporter NhaA [Caldilineales bacterium]|nr:Na+/H+ antiporter NhaA [Caldilineales bacterium]
MKVKSVPLGVDTSTPITRLARTFQRFAEIEGSGGIVLLICALIGLALANSPWSQEYMNFLDRHFLVAFDPLFTLDLPLSQWVNDGLMVVFFFVVGLEIKREILIGELSSPRRAVLPIMAATGGMVVPALIYVLFNHGGTGERGWGIPMATDIAFALGALSLLGRRVPVSLKVFLTALAIADDLGAVLVIAIFYTDTLNMLALELGILTLLALVIFNRLGGRSLVVYGLLGLITWIDFFFSGVHATVAGVLVAMTIPVRNRIDAQTFLERGRRLLDWFEHHGGHGRHEIITPDQRMAIHELEQACKQVETPLHRFETILHPWVAYLIMPIFALTNAGVALNLEMVRHLLSPVGLGIFFGLVVGKFVGIFTATFLAVKLKLAVLPRNVRWVHVAGVACLGGMGFTMSLFIAGLAFGGHDFAVLRDAPHLALTVSSSADPLLHNVSKLAILTASLTAGMLGSLILLRVPMLSEAEAAAEE